MAQNSLNHMAVGSYPIDFSKHRNVIYSKRKERNHENLAKVSQNTNAGILDNK